MTELKKCPFCGVIPERFIHGTGAVSANHPKNDCILSGGCFLIDYWQSRPIEETLQGRIDELEFIVKSWEMLWDDIGQSPKSAIDYKALMIKTEQELQKMHDELSALRASVKEAAEEIESEINSKSDCTQYYVNGLDLALFILKKHGLLED